MNGLRRDPVLLAWLALVAATIASWSMGHEGRHSDSPTTSVLVLAIAALKVRLVGLYFMDLRVAPARLRIVFETYCAGSFVLLTGLLVLA